MKQKNNKGKVSVMQMKPEKSEKTCGIIMPISPSPEYPTQHWSNVRQILFDTVSEIDFTPKLVSDDPAIGLIHERIVKNIYNNEMIICDVSSKNPNVMFELGLRLAFDKPTIIIKDELTGYSFDTGVVEHIEYPSTLRFNQIIEFKEKLKDRIVATFRKYKDDKSFSPFLKSFGKTIVPANIHNQNIPESQFIQEQLENITKELKILRVENSNIRLNLNIKNGQNGQNEITNISYSLINKFLEEYFTNSKDLNSITEASSYVLNRLLEIDPNSYVSKADMYMMYNSFKLQRDNLKIAGRSHSINVPK